MLASITRFRALKLPSGACGYAAETTHQDFRVFDLKKGSQQDGDRRGKRGGRMGGPVLMPPREKKMPIDQDWPSVWPGPRTFHPASVPLPVRQGYPAYKNQAPPDKYANAELMKIPNFLHLTPQAVQRHCEALKRFCTKWPEALRTEEDCEKHFPVKTTVSDYIHSSPSIRDPLSRIVTLQIKMSSLPLEGRARDKFLRLVKERYDPKTDTVTIVTDRCPTKKQNKDYADFLLTALYHESQREESWEQEKSPQDNELFDWQTSASRASVEQLASRNQQLDQEFVEQYSKAVTNLIDNGEDEESLADYKARTMKMLGYSRN